MVIGRHRGGDSFSAAMSRGDYEVAVESLRRSGGLADLGRYTLQPSQVGSVVQAATREDALYNLGVAVWAIDGGELEGLDILTAAAEAGSVDAAAAVGEALAWFGRPELAAEWLSSQTLAGPRRFWLSGILGESLLATGDISHAMGFLAAAYSTHREFGVAYAKALRLSGDPIGARTVLLPLVERKVYGAAIQVGLIEEALGNLNAAEAAYRDGIETGDAHSAYNLGLLLSQQGRAVESRDAFDRAASMGDATPVPNDGP